MQSQKFIHKVTGEIVTQVDIMKLSEYRKYFGVCSHCGTEIDENGRCGYKGDD